MGDKQVMAKSMEQIIIARNLATSFDEKVQIMSIVAETTPFSVLNQYNPINERENLMIEDGDEEEDTIIEEENVETLTETGKNLEMSLNTAMKEEAGSLTKANNTKTVYFNPIFSRHEYRKARFHNRLSGAGKPYVKEKSAKWKLSPEIMETIVDYVTSTQEMQSVAHGTLQITLDSGRKTRISGVIRKNSQAQLVRQLKALLQELGIKVPSERSLRRILKNLPAKRSRLITGIDRSYEDHRRAFTTIKEILEKLEAKKSNDDDWCNR